MYKNCLTLMLVFVLLLAVSVNGELIGQWELDGNALDSGGYGYDGTIVGGVTATTDRNGNPNSAMLFSGASGTYIDIGDVSAFRMTGSMTLMGWCWMDSTMTTAGRVICKQGDSSHRGWTLNTEPVWDSVTKPPVFYVAPSASSLVYVCGSSTLPMNQWFHWAGVYTSGATPSMKIYINGGLVATKTTGVPTSQYSNNSKPVAIGNRTDASCGWKGKLDDVRVYNNALSATEIEAIVLGAPVVKATSPSPGDAATGVGINDDLSWTAGASAVSHDVYFGTSLAAVTNASRLLGDIDGSGAVGVEDIAVLAQQWLGTPVEPYADLDGDDDVNMIDFAVVSADWLDSSDAVYKGNQSGTTFDPGAMASNTTYYWRIDEVNDAELDSPWTGDVWSFTTEDLAPGQASNPSPGNGASSIGVDENLSWTAGAGATSHDVYFGQDATPDAGEFQGNQAGTTFEPGTMQESRTYYWRIDEVNAYGTTTGTVWSFTVGAVAPVGYWNLDETSGSIASDSSGAGINGTLVNMDSSDWVSGMVNGALDFDGVNDYVSMARSSVLEIGNATTHELSVTAWVKSDYTSAPTGYTTVVGTGDGGWLIANSPSTDTVYFACWLLNGASGQTAVAANTTVVHDGDWHHIVGVYDGASVHMYVDGVHGETGTIGGTIRNMFDMPVHLGTNAAASGRYWDGLIDEVRIYSIALTEDDIAYLANPNTAWDPSPAKNATGVNLEADLSWAAGALAVSHDVYLGTDSATVASATTGSAQFEGNQAATSFDPGTLDAETDYYWRIDEVNTSEPGSPWTGAVWHFTTASLKATNPSPADGGTASLNATLSWTAGSGAVSHDVYFGTTSPGTYQGNQPGTTFDPGTMVADLVHYWRIDEISSYGTTTGDVWSFTSTALPRVIVSSDIGGADPDDFQSLVHYLVCADRFDTEGLIASPPYAGRVSDILATLDAYETDYSNLSSHGNFPTPLSLRDVSKQGAIDVSPSAGYSTATDGSNQIVTRANVSDSRPLWIQVWGSITDVAQAVHDDPGIKSKIRVYSIGSWNTAQDVNARNYLYNNHSDMWWIENDSTFRGMYIGGDQSGDLGNVTFVAEHVRYHGALGDFYYSKKTDIKMGDTPAVLYMFSGDPDDPTVNHWGGRFQTTGHGTHYWHDLTDPAYAESGYNGAKTVNVWREDYLRDWETRMDWADAP